MSNLVSLCGVLFLATVLAVGFFQAIDPPARAAAPVLIRSR